MATAAADGRTSLLAVLAVASLFASPYAPHLPGYYRTVLFNGEFAKYLPDWMPTALGPRTAAFYLLAFAAVFAIARAPKTLTLFEKSAILVSARARDRGEPRRHLVHSVRARRAAERASRVATSERPVRRVTRGLSSQLSRSIGALVVAASRPASWFTRDYPTSAAHVVAAAAGPNARVFANGAFSDWLLFKEPSLRGRIAYDARFEVLPNGRLADAAAVSIGRYDSERILRPFDVLVLRPEETELRGTLERAGDWRRVDAGTKVVVLRRVTG